MNLKQEYVKSSGAFAPSILYKRRWIMAGIKGQKSGGSKNAGRKKLPVGEKRNKTFTTKVTEKEYEILMELLTSKRAELKLKTNIEVLLTALEKL